MVSGRIMLRPDHHRQISRSIRLQPVHHCHGLPQGDFADMADGFSDGIRNGHGDGAVVGQGTHGADQGCFPSPVAVRPRREKARLPIGVRRSGPPADAGRATGAEAIAAALGDAPTQSGPHGHAGNGYAMRGGGKRGRSAPTVNLPARIGPVEFGRRPLPA
jgi:hypothetical protein